MATPDEFSTNFMARKFRTTILLDIDAALGLIDEFSETTYVIIKHNNACGAASRPNPADAWKDALACDPVSAYGGVIATNVPVGDEEAAEIDKIFFEIIIAPGLF